MDEIVSKPLTPQGYRRATKSASDVRKTDKQPSANLKRPKTSLSSSRKNGTPIPKKWNKKPGPFATVKIPQNEMWVVSNSTPCKYFMDDDAEFDPDSKPRVP